jgi:Dolichyl-phosphate-mannose-protein mannosyltransferase
MSSSLSSTEPKNLTQTWWFFPALIAMVYVALHMATASRYGYFRDALYYLACAEHMDWGYVDHPPLIVAIAWIARHFMGTSLRALLLWPALAGCARILLISVFARELGAGRFGTGLAAVLGATPGVWWAIDHQFAMNAFEPVLWIGCAFTLLQMIKTGNAKLWVVFGAIAGIGLENKYSIAVFCMALLAGLLFRPQRKLLFTPWLLIGGGVAFLIFLPNFVWNVQHHWPFFELMHNIRTTGRDIVPTATAFLSQQVLILSPPSLPFWLAGLFYYLCAREAKAYRVFGWAFVITVGFFLLAHGKNYYSAPAYTVVLAAGGVIVERWLSAGILSARPSLRTGLQVGAVAWLILLGILPLLPVTLPILPIDTYLKYQEYLPFQIPRSEHIHMGAVLPQHYADEFGWPEMVAQIARVYQSLPEDQRAKAAIYTDNYGEAAAVDFYGGQYGLPKAICANQSYFLWGPRNYTGEIMILVGSESPQQAKPFFESVETAAEVNNRYALPRENVPVLLCRGLKGNLRDLWPRLKDWD